MCLNPTPPLPSPLPRSRPQIGHPLSSLLTEPETAETLMERCRTASAEDLAAGDITMDLLLTHRYRQPVPVRATVRLAGGCRSRLRVGVDRGDRRKGDREPSRANAVP